MKTINATFKIVTPMFLGDAKQKATSIRPLSVKGALRFWWRALNWKDAIEYNHGNNDAALRWLHSEESRLFGSAADESGVNATHKGQGASLLKVQHGRLQNYASGKELWGSNGGIEYLMGQGLWHFRNKLTRDAIKEGQEFSVALAFKPNTTEEDISGIVKAFCLFGLLGSLGSRARHGFGSVAIKKVETNGIALPCDLSLTHTKDGYIQVLKQLIGDVSGIKMPPISAFSSESKIAIMCEKPTPKDTLSCIGKKMQLYRSYGRKDRDNIHKVGGQPAEQNFKEDHDNVLKMSMKNPPRRTVFGLPHNYFFSSDRTQIEINAFHENMEGRRASPLLLHIHPIGKNHVAVHTLLHSVFLPEDASIVVKNKKSKVTKHFSPNVDYGVIEQYLNRFKDAERILG